MSEPVAGGAVGRPGDADCQAVGAAVAADTDVARADAVLGTGRRRDFGGRATGVVGGQASEVGGRIAIDATGGQHRRIARADGRARRVGGVDRIAKRLTGHIGRRGRTGGQLGVHVGAKARAPAVGCLGRRGGIAGYDGRGRRGVDQPTNCRVGRCAARDALVMRRLGIDGRLREQEGAKREPDDQTLEHRDQLPLSLERNVPASREKVGDARLKYSSV